MAVPVPEGDSKVEFRFEYHLIKYAVFISIEGIALSLLYVFVSFAINKKKKSSAAADSELASQSPENTLTEQSENFENAVNHEQSENLENTAKPEQSENLENAVNPEQSENSENPEQPLSDPSDDPPIQD